MKNYDSGFWVLTVLKIASVVIRGNTKITDPYSKGKNMWHNLRLGFD